MDGSTPSSRLSAGAFWLSFAVILFGQAGIGLQMFGPDHSWARLNDDQPILSGRHPLHLYHSMLGSQTFRDRYSTSCYDPNFQAGYLKTPVFDGGCRPTEAMLLLFRGYTPAAAYKLGIYWMVLMVPLVFAITAWSLGLTPLGILLSAACGCLMSWSPAVRVLLDAGNLDLLLAGLMAIIFAGGMVRYATHLVPTSWLLLALPSIVGWYAHPIVWLGLLPIFLIYYVILAPRYGLAWHLGILGVTFAGLAPNFWWLWNWGRFWWLRQPNFDELSLIPSMNAILGSDDSWREIIGPGFVGIGVVVAGLLGLIFMLRRGDRLAAGVMTAAVSLAAITTHLGHTWPTFQDFASDRAAPLVPTFLVFPASYLLSKWVEQRGAAALVAVASSLLLLLIGWVLNPDLPTMIGVPIRSEPLTIGYTPDQQQFVQALREQTTSEARILIEKADTTRVDWNWTALLPTLTDRAFLGGLDPDAAVEHTFCGMAADHLNGRRFSDWTTEERRAFCERYNVGWVVCRSTAALAWWSSDPTTKVLGTFHDGETLTLLEVARPRSYFRSGQGRIEQVDHERLVLTDVIPDADGEVVLSFHYHPNVRVAPTTIRVEPEKDLFDPMPTIKLRLQGAMSRVTLTWGNP